MHLLGYSHPRGRAVRGRSARTLGNAAGLIALGAGIAAAQGDESRPAGERPALRAGVLSAGLHLDGRLTEPEWLAAADSIADLTMVEPDEGSTPTAPTIIKVLASDREVVVGIRCIDLEPGAIVSFSKARDSELAEEDNVFVVFDTF